MNETKTIEVPLALFEKLTDAFIQLAMMAAFPPVIRVPDGSLQTVPFGPGQVIDFSPPDFTAVDEANRVLYEDLRACRINAEIKEANKGIECEYGVPV